MALSSFALVCFSYTIRKYSCVDYHRVFSFEHLSRRQVNVVAFARLNEKTNLHRWTNVNFSRYKLVSWEILITRTSLMLFQGIKTRQKFATVQCPWLMKSGISNDNSDYSYAYNVFYSQGKNGEHWEWCPSNIVRIRHDKIGIFREIIDTHRPYGVVMQKSAMCVMYWKEKKHKR